MQHNRYIVLLVQNVLMRELTNNNNAPVLTRIPAQLQVFSQWVRLHCIDIHFFVFYILASFYDPHKPESLVLGPACHG